MSSTPTNIVNEFCPHCNQRFNSYLQQPLSPKSTAPDYWISTCDTQGCAYEKVTLEDSQWSKLISDPAMQAEYQKQVRIRRMSPAELKAYYATQIGGAK